MPYPPDGPWVPQAPIAEDPSAYSFEPVAPVRKFRNRTWLHVALLLATIVTTTVAGATHYAAFVFASHGEPPVLGLRELFELRWLLPGFWYSGTLLLILGAHEMGHYLLCRRYDIDATLPFFLPMPPVIFLTGTLGAVIRIRERFPNRRVLFDVGIAGPIAGFVFLVPALFYGMTLSNVVPAPTDGLVLSLGEPLLFRWATHAVFGAIPDGYTVNIHPMVFAAWFGLLATALNLLPFGQLDGGHITYATLGRLSVPISLATVTACIVMTFASLSWAFMTVMMLVMLFLLGPRHPRVLYEYESLGRGRIALALFALVMLILCFTPTPLEIQDLVRAH